MREGRNERMNEHTPRPNKKLKKKIKTSTFNLKVRIFPPTQIFLHQFSDVKIFHRTSFFQPIIPFSAN